VPASQGLNCLIFVCWSADGTFDKKITPDQVTSHLPHDWPSPCRWQPNQASTNAKHLRRCISPASLLNLDWRATTSTWLSHQHLIEIETNPMEALHDVCQICTCQSMQSVPPPRRLEGVGLRWAPASGLSISAVWWCTETEQQQFCSVGVLNFPSLCIHGATTIAMHFMVVSRPSHSKG